MNTDFQPYKYNGQGSCQRGQTSSLSMPSAAEAQPKVKELDKMHGLYTYDYGARQHDPILCRWDRMDPLCEKYYGVSPYAYCHNNPVILTDPDGRKIDTTQMSANEQDNYNEFIKNLCSFEMFKTVYDALEKSDATFKISFDKRLGASGDYVDGQFVVGKDLWRAFDCFLPAASYHLSCRKPAEILGEVKRIDILELT